MPDIFCSKCGTRNIGAGQFCQQCGATLSMGAAVQPVQTSAPAYPASPAYPAPPAYALAPASPYGGFWIRLLAYIIDRIVVGIAATPLVFMMALPTITRIAHEAEQNQDNPSSEFVFSILGALSTFFVLIFVGYWLYEALLTSSSWQGTVGKRVLRLKVTDEAGNRIGFGRSTGRFFAKLLSYLLFYIGFIIAP